MNKNYLNYLNFVQGKLSKYFFQQEPYICCKKGCAKCCQQGEYPFSKIEFEFLMEGFFTLPIEKQQIIMGKVQQVIHAREVNTEKEFMYECPFLINNECSAYNYRGVICRTFGLISSRENGNPKVPFCAFEGLNYSQVLDDEKKSISGEKFSQLNIEQEPLAYNVSYKFLTSKAFEQEFGFEFGEMRPLIDWFKKPQY